MTELDLIELDRLTQRILSSNGDVSNDVDRSDWQYIDDTVWTNEVQEIMNSIDGINAVSTSTSLRAGGGGGTARTAGREEAAKAAATCVTADLDRLTSINARVTIDDRYADFADLDLMICDQNTMIGDQDAMICGDQNTMIVDRKARICDWDTIIGDQNTMIGDLDARICDRDAIIGDQAAMIGDHDATIRDRDTTIGNQVAKIGDQNTIFGDRDSWIRDQNAMNGDPDATIGDHNAMIGDHDAMIGDHDAMIGDHDAIMGFRDPAILVNRDSTKPEYSYVALISMAILSSPERKLILADIYKYISGNFPHHIRKSSNWKNNVRYNLSLNQCFVKRGRTAHGGCNYWSIHPSCVDEFSRGDYRRRLAKKRNRRSAQQALKPVNAPQDRMPCNSPKALMPCNNAQALVPCNQALMPRHNTRAVMPFNEPHALMPRNALQDRMPCRAPRAQMPRSYGHCEQVAAKATAAAFANPETMMTSPIMTSQMTSPMMTSQTSRPSCKYWNSSEIGNGLAFYDRPAIGRYAMRDEQSFDQFDRPTTLGQLHPNVTGFRIVENVRRIWTGDFQQCQNPVVPFPADCARFSDSFRYDFDENMPDILY